MKPIENSDELKELAPMLSSIERKQVFSVPGNYFDSLSNEIMDKVAAASSLEEIAASNPFAVPENYFEGLPMDIIKRIDAEKAKGFSLAAVLSKLLRPKYALSLITACFALFICVRFFEKPVTMNVAHDNASVISISDTDLPGELDESTLMNEISEHNIALLGTDNKTVADKEMEDYIINNNIDLSDLTKEL